MKLLATDLDGTLLNENHEISEENVQAIKKAEEHGIQVVVATGRTYHAAKKPLEAAGLNLPIICLNGAKIYDNAGQLLKSTPLEEQDCKRIQAICEKEGLYFEVFTNQGGFTKSREGFLQVMIDIMMSFHPTTTREEIREMALQRFQDEEIKITPDINKLFEREDIIVYKILAFSIKNENLNPIYLQLKDKEDLAITSSGFSNLEFNHKDAQKGPALEHFAKTLNIAMKDVMAIGDSYNDVSMLTMAGRGVAMANADNEIKQLCNYTTKTNREHGFAHAVEEMLDELKVM